MSDPHPLSPIRPTTHTLQKAELVAVLKRLALPMEQVIAQGRASASSGRNGNRNSTNGAGPSSPSALAAPPLSFFPPNPEALMMMTGMGPPSRGPTAGAAAEVAAAAAKGDGALKSDTAAPSIEQQPPSSSSSSAAAGDKMVLVTLSRDRGGAGGGARLFYPSRLIGSGTAEEEAFRQELSRLVTARLLPLLSVGGGAEVDAAGWEIDWKPALSYRKTVLRLTGGMPTVVLVRAGDGAECETEGLVETGAQEGGGGTPVVFDVLVKGVV